MVPDVFGPIEQARRCLDLWLKEEKRRMDAPQRQRAAALIARYFLHEDQVTDRLLLSFLRHYSGRKEIDIEDPASVRREIKALLDQSRPRSLAIAAWERAVAGAALCVILALSSAGAWHYAHKKITPAQQAELRMLVDDNAARGSLTHPRDRSEIKAPLEVKSYRDISWWDYAESKERLLGMKAAPGS
jgi:hypothetical protein